MCYRVRVGGAAQLRQILTDVSGIAGAPPAVADGNTAAAARTTARQSTPLPTNGISDGSGSGHSGGHGGHGGSGNDADGSAANGDSAAATEEANGGWRKGGGAAAGAGGSSGGGMCAILGPSGAGKTTLLDILAGRRYGAGTLETNKDPQSDELGPSPVK